MPTIEIELKGLSGVQKAIDNLADVSEWGTGVMVQWGQIEQARLKAKKYPPKRPGQKYIRTGRLGRSWSSRGTGNLEVTIRNRAAFKGRFYAPYVVGDNQSWMHVGRWWIGRESIIEEGIPKLEEMLNDEAERIWGE